MKTGTGRARMLAIMFRVFLAVIYLLHRVTLKLVTRLKFRPVLDVPPEVKMLKGPYVVLADHVHPLDMAMVTLGLRPVIRWLTTDTVFRTALGRFVFRYVLGCIPKSKNRSDMAALARLILLTDIGCVIGIFHEGELSWDGVNKDSVPGTDKLIRLLKVPVVYARFEGGYLDKPRWSWSRNHAPVRIRYSLVIGRDEARSLVLSDISRRLRDASQYNEWEFQATAQLRLKGNRRAEHMELLCFLCPGCRKVGTLRSRGNRFECTECPVSGEFNTLGFIDWIQEADPWPQNEPFNTVRDWNVWQISWYTNLVRDIATGDRQQQKDKMFWEDQNCVSLKRWDRNHVLRQSLKGTARLFPDRIEFAASGTTLNLPLAQITGLNVFKQYDTDFYFNKELHRMTGTHRSVSGYKWQLLVRLLGNSRDSQTTHTVSEEGQGRV